ncbi:MAG: carbon monoxide dehydrogenase subunit [Mycobacterium sp.]|nr:carbon monoxide dehydrogenase subunit [Mycobacterium sp.]
MKLENSFTIPAPPEAAWAVLLDVARVAPCMPGATLTEVDGDNFAGTVKVKVGPIGLTYKGTAAFVEKDGASHTAVIDAKGRETRGSGTVNAKITCKLLPDGEGTRVEVVTDLAITGRPAQFGRGVIGEVAGKVITQFAGALSEEISSGTPAPAAEAPAAETPAAVEPEADVAPPAAEETLAPRATEALQAAAAPPAPAAPSDPAPRRSAEAIDLLDVAGAPVAKRLAPAAAVLAFVLLILFLRRKRK